MNKEQAQALGDKVKQECQHLHADLQPENDTWQVWVYSEKTDRIPIVLKTAYDWTIAKTYRDMFVQPLERLQAIEAAASDALAHLNWMDRVGALTDEDMPMVEGLRKAFGQE